jgi:hypothetical protein
MKNGLDKAVSSGILPHNRCRSIRGGIILYEYFNWKISLLDHKSVQTMPDIILVVERRAKNGNEGSAIHDFKLLQPIASSYMSGIRY